MTDRALTLLVWGGYLALLVVVGIAVGLTAYNLTH